MIILLLLSSYIAAIAGDVASRPAMLHDLLEALGR
jgi:hypothetical protein